jgi:hypothetical protein
VETSLLWADRIRLLPRKLQRMLRKQQKRKQTKRRRRLRRPAQGRKVLLKQLRLI